MLTERAIIRRLILPEPVCDSDLSVCESLLSICQERGVKCEFYARKNGESIDVNGVELSFFDLVELSRSDHPVVAFEAWLGGRHAVYAGGSSSEGDTALADALFLSDLAVFGSHPPVYKVPFEVGAGGNAVFTEDALASGCLADVAIGGESVILERDGSYSCGNYEIR